MREFGRVVLAEPMFGHKAGEIGAVTATRDIVARGNGKVGAGVVVEADSVVEAGRLGHGLAEPANTLNGIEEPPGRPKLQRGVMPASGASSRE